MSALIRSRVLLVLARPSRAVVVVPLSVRYYASVKDNGDRGGGEDEKEYEIDLITLKKKYKQKPSTDDEFAKNFKNELKLLQDFVSKNPSIREYLNLRTKLNSKTVENLLDKFKSQFFKDYLVNQLKCDVTKIYQMCNQLLKIDSSFLQKILIKNEDEQINNILKVFNKPLEKRRKMKEFNNSDIKLLELTKKKSKILELENEIKARQPRSSNDDFLNKFLDEMTTSKEFKDESSLQKLTAADIRDKYAKLYTPNTAKEEEPLESIEIFLQKLKQSNEMSKEENFRRQKAYEWSRSKLINNDNTLEDGKFFSPKLVPGTLIPLSILNPFNKSSNDLLFPMLHQKLASHEYLILTSKGKTIKCGSANPMGFNYIPKDLFTILSNLENPELYIRYIRKLSRQDWKLIAGSDDKILVFSRNEKNRFFKLIWNFSKKIFTLIGMLSTGLVIGSFFIDDDLQFKNAKRIVHVGEIDIK